MLRFAVDGRRSIPFLPARFDSSAGAEYSSLKRWEYRNEPILFRGEAGSRTILLIP